MKNSNDSSSGSTSVAPRKSGSFSYRKIIKKLASIKMAVVVISSIAILTAIGTIVESRYDAMAAQKLVYRSWWMYGVMGVFAANLIAVMLDRWPWKSHHSSFVCAHIGILVIMLGQYLSGTYGLDGTMRIDIGQNSRFVSVQQTDINIYASYDGDNYTKLYEQEVDFFLDRPQDEKLVFKLEEELQFVRYEPYVLPQKEIEKSENQQAGSGLRFQVKNPNVSVIEWLVQKNPRLVASHDFGPAQIYLGSIPPHGQSKNEIYLEVIKENNQPTDKVKYAIFSKENLKPIKTGIIEEGQAIQTGWMGLELRVLRFLPRAQENWIVKPVERPTPMTTSAAQFVYRGKEHWLLLNDTVKLFSEKAVYYVTYGNRRIDVGFPVTLKEFKVERYQGTARAAAYESSVSVPGIEHHEISMNEPLKYQGLTFYQASFQEDQMGRPIASILSVNYDPGRWLKYLGSLIMTLGIILLFYFKKRKKTSS